MLFVAAKVHYYIIQEDGCVGLSATVRTVRDTVPRAGGVLTSCNHRSDVPSSPKLAIRMTMDGLTTIYWEEHFLFNPIDPRRHP